MPGDSLQGWYVCQRLYSTLTWGQHLLRQQQTAGSDCAFVPGATASSGVGSSVFVHTLEGFVCRGQDRRMWFRSVCTPLDIVLVTCNIAQLRHPSFTYTLHIERCSVLLQVLIH